MTKLLLVNNDIQSCHILAQALNQDGYDVVTASQGDEGLILATTASPDLILLDMNVPVVNSWQIIKVLRKSKATWLIPVIAMANRTIDRQPLLQAGFDTYVRKPVSLRTLLPRIEIVLDNVSAVRRVPSKLVTSNTVSMVQEATHPQQQNEPTTVVYVDDRPDKHQPIVEIIQRAGYGCVRIPDALQDLPQLLKLRPQLIFINLAVPMGHSYELCAQIRQISVFKETPIVIVTDSNNIADRLRASISGVSGFIRKTDKAQPILKALMKYLDLSLQES